MKGKLKRQKAKVLVWLGIIWVVLTVPSVGQDLEPFAKKIKSGSTDEKREVLFQIRNLQTAEASRVAVPALQDNDEIVRATATGSVIFLPAAESLQVLLPLLKDKSVLVRKETVFALGKTKNSNAAGPLILTLRNDQDLEVKAVSAQALGELGDLSAVAALVKILQKKPNQEDDFLRRAAARSIGQIAQIEQVKKSYMVTTGSLLPEPDKTPAKLKYSNLGESFPVFRQSVDVLISVLQSSQDSDDTKREAAFALGTIGDPQAIEILQLNLSAKDYYLAGICRESLQKLGKLL
jgi:HEAT repeat protein